MTEPKIYSDEEIELFVVGDRRAIDTLLLKGYNSMAQAFVHFRDEEFRSHAAKEERVLDALGTPEEIELNMAWLRAQVTKERVYATVRQKILLSAVAWAVPLVLAGFWLVFSTGAREALSNWLKPAEHVQGK